MEILNLKTDKEAAASLATLVALGGAEDYVRAMREGVEDLKKSLADLGSQVETLKANVATATGNNAWLEGTLAAAERQVHRQAAVIRELAARLRAAGLSDRVGEDDKPTLGAGEAPAA